MAPRPPHPDGDAVPGAWLSAAPLCGVRIQHDLLVLGLPAGSAHQLPANSLLPHLQSLPGAAAEEGQGGGSSQEQQEEREGRQGGRQGEEGAGGLPRAALPRSPPGLVSGDVPAGGRAHPPRHLLHRPPRRRLPPPPLPSQVFASDEAGAALRAHVRPLPRQHRLLAVHALGPLCGVGRELRRGEGCVRAPRAPPARQDPGCLPPRARELGRGPAGVCPRPPPRRRLQPLSLRHAPDARDPPRAAPDARSGPTASSSHPP
mmetsp:Transcript_37613/g.88941  ORF Transcript_37613/g.88941 Transcript_37613/m.88941 type:complete len:260 (+) Transcript_37613:756-1535(+)